MTGLTQKQEVFAQKVVELGDKAKAYRAAFNTERMKDKTIWEAASRLAKNSKVAARMEQLQQEHLNRHNVTVDLLTEKLWKAEKLAHSVENPSAAVSAVMGVGKLHGLIVDKVKGDPNAPVYINEIKMIVVDSRNDTEH